MKNSTLNSLPPPKVGVFPKFRGTPTVVSCSSVDPEEIKIDLTDRGVLTQHSIIRDMGINGDIERFDSRDTRVYNNFGATERDQYGVSPMEGLLGKTEHRINGSRDHICTDSCSRFNR